MNLLHITTEGHLLSILGTLKEWDTWFLLKINRDWSNSFFDQVLPIWRNQNTWLPLYAFLFFFVVLNFEWKSYLPWIIGFVATIALCDQVSSGILKDWVNRTRPCNDPLLMYRINFLLNYKPTGGSFTSSHATNHFGMAFFIYHTLKNYFNKWVYLFFFWAATISYAQVYVGVHFPLDVICGAMLGTLLGSLVAMVFHRYFGLTLIKQRPAGQTTTS